MKPAAKKSTQTKPKAAVKTVAARRTRGRPMGFDRTTAVLEAMKLFWERGFEGTSFDELITAMNISPSSFYHAFGSKQALYKEAVDTYLNGHAAFFRAALAKKTTTKQAFTALLEQGAAAFTHPDFPAGCMVSLAGTHLPPALDPVRDFAKALRQFSEKAMTERLRRGIADGDVPPNTNAEELASYFGTVIRGLAVQARDGASRERMLMISRAAMRIWPAS